MISQYLVLALGIVVFAAESPLTPPLEGIIPAPQSSTLEAQVPIAPGSAEVIPEGLEGLEAVNGTTRACAPSADCDFICPKTYRWNCNPPSCFCYSCPSNIPPGCVYNNSCFNYCYSWGFNQGVVCQGIQFKQCSCFC